MTTPGEPPALPPPPPIAPPPSLPPAERVRAAWQARARTDYRFVNPWLNVVLVIITCGIYAFVLMYQLVRRSREHNARRLEMLDAATTFAWNEAYKQELGEELRPAFERISVYLESLRTMTRDFRDPAIWLVIYFFGGVIAQVVLFVLLDGDLIKHDRAEGAAEAELAAIYARLGQAVPAPDPGRVKGPDNYGGRIALSIVTCGIYSAVWWLVDRQRDGDRHYDENWPWEDWLAQAVDNLDPTTA